MLISLVKSHTLLGIFIEGNGSAFGMRRLKTGFIYYLLLTIEKVVSCSKAMVNK